MFSVKFDITKKKVPLNHYFTGNFMNSQKNHICSHFLYNNSKDKNIKNKNKYNIK